MKLIYKGVIMEGKIKIILASSSKTRQNIIKSIGLKYEVVKSLVEEKSDSTNPSEYVKDLSRDKENSVANQITEMAIIISQTYCFSILYLKNILFWFKCHTIWA